MALNYEERPASSGRANSETPFRMDHQDRNALGRDASAATSEAGVMSTVLAAAREAHAAGLSIIPIKPDGSKSPAVPWAPYQSVQPTPAQVEQWFADESRGLAVIGGPISGNLEWIDFDDRGVYAAYRAAAAEVGLGELVERIRMGYEEFTPEGVHLAIRCSELSGNTKLAARPDSADSRKPRALIETRGTGGYAIVAPSNGRVHSSGKAYRRMAGSFATIATVTPGERRALLDLAESFDEMPPEEDPSTSPASVPTASSLRPGDAFRARHADLAGWRSILEPNGWVLTHTRGNVGYWRRPGKSEGWSATTGHAGTDLLYVFSESTELPARKGLNPFTAYALLEHAGDFRKAAQALAEQGYGEQRNAAPEATSAGGGAHRAAERGARPELHPKARYGLAGEFVAAFEPDTEADPAALLASFLVAFGNACGPTPHAWVSETRHRVNLAAVNVGATSRSRKGTSWGPVERVFGYADPDWLHDRRASGIGSGEGIIWAVRDPSGPKVDPKTGQSIIEDEGVRDKRLMVLESEFSSVLKVAGRDSSILSEIIRKAWDGDTLQNIVKRSPVKATNPHVSILGHITEEELRRELSETDQVNGLANRFLWVYVRRSKLLPDAPRLDEAAAAALGMQVRRALEHARTCEQILRDEPAADVWRRAYADLSKDYPGMFGALTARAEAHVLRLSMVYALLDCSNVVRLEHLTAALAFWHYCEDSARYIFGDRTGDPVADRIRGALRTSGTLTETDIRDLFGRHQKADRVQRTLESLLTAGMVAVDTVETGGRPARVWRAIK